MITLIKNDIFKYIIHRVIIQLCNQTTGRNSECIFLFLDCLNECNVFQKGNVLPSMTCWNSFPLQTRDSSEMAESINFGKTWSLMLYFHIAYLN